MDSMEIAAAFGGIYQKKRVFITGHTGFKGSWLMQWLTMLGANVCGYALHPPSQPAHFNILKNKAIKHIYGDIRERVAIEKAVQEFQPDIIFHLAAQALVHQSYQQPVETYETNVTGTLNVLEAARKAGAKAVINVTSDKCYQNNEWIWGYRENDPMGGFDPYSSSKGCAELLSSSYRNSFFNTEKYGETHHTLLATARAGNVVGGGDWAANRLVPDVVRAIARNEEVSIRQPKATRPWQHVLEPLSGYLLLGQKLLEGQKQMASAWNFGPDNDGTKTVVELLAEMKNHWTKLSYQIETNSNQPHEARLLKLDCSKAHQLLGWQPVWSFAQCIQHTTEWYKNYYEKNTVITEQQIADYTAKMMNTRKTEYAQ